MSEDVEALNPGIFRLHRVFYVAFFAFGALMLVIGLATLLHAGHEHEAGLAFVGVILVPLGVRARVCRSSAIVSEHAVERTICGE